MIEDFQGLGKRIFVEPDAIQTDLNRCEKGRTGAGEVGINCDRNRALFFRFAHETEMNSNKKPSMS